MNILLAKSKNNWCEDCCDGISNGLSPLIYQTGIYLESSGLDVVTHEFTDTHTVPVGKYDVVALFSSLAGLLESLLLLERAKALGLTTILILHDSFGVEKDLMDEFHYLDYCILYPEREIALRQLLNDLQTKSDLKPDGILFRSDGMIRQSRLRCYSNDLHHLKSCAPYLEKALEKHEYTHCYLTLGRGCPFACSFCDVRRTPIRKRAVADIVDELQVIQKHASLKEQISFIDPHFASDSSWTESLSSEFLSNRIDVSWRITTRYDSIVDPALLNLWRRAGCVKVGMGLEHLDRPDIKRVDLPSFTNAVKMLQSARIKPVISIIVGLWEDSDESLNRLYVSLEHLGDVEVLATPFMPLRNTPIYDNYLKQNIIPPLNYSDYMRWGYAYPMLPTKHLNTTEVENWLHRFELLSH